MVGMAYVAIQANIIERENLHLLGVKERCVEI